jgi:hypothetical protein
MTDLSVQDFNDLSSEKLVPVLLNERMKMLGEEQPQLSMTGDARLFLSSLAGLITTVPKTGERNVSD